MILKEIFDAELARVGITMDDIEDKYDTIKAVTDNIGAVNIDIEICEEAIKVAIVLPDDKLAVITSPFEEFYPIGDGEVIYSFFIEGVKIRTGTADVVGFKNNFEKYMRNVG